MDSFLHRFLHRLFGNSGGIEPHSIAAPIPTRHTDGWGVSEGGR